MSRLVRRIEPPDDAEEAEYTPQQAEQQGLVTRTQIAERYGYSVHATTYWLEQEDSPKTVGKLITGAKMAALWRWSEVTPYLHKRFRRYPLDSVETSSEVKKNLDRFIHEANERGLPDDEVIIIASKNVYGRVTLTLGDLKILSNQLF